MSVQEELPLQHTPQLTGWFDGAPALQGWYNTRAVEDNPLAHAPNAPTMRRYWDGSQWSRPVVIGANESATARARFGRSVFQVGQLQYQGLAEPHPDYEWNVGFARVAMERRRLGAA